MIVNHKTFCKILFSIVLFSIVFLARQVFAVTLLSNISETNDKGTSIFRSNIWVAYKFTAGASATISSVTIDLDHTASNYTGFSTYTSGVVRFYNDNGGVVGSQITGTLTYTSTNTGNGVTVYGTASGGTITLPASGNYWMGLTCASCANIDYQESSSTGYSGSTGWQTVISSSAVSSSNNNGSTWGTPYSTSTYGTAMITIAGSLADSTAPTITNISSDKADGSYKAGDVVDIDVTFSEAVTSTGNVTVTLETGDTDRTCIFTVSSETTGTCNYTVQAGDTSSDLTVSLISGTIADGASNAMTNFTPVTNLAVNKALVIDTTAPVVTESTAVTNPTTDITPDYIFSTTEAGTISYGGSCSSGTTSATLGLNTITFTTLADATYSDCTIMITDTATNSSNVLSVTSFTIDTTAPIISSISSTVDKTTATITWITNENSSSQVSYGLTSAYETTTTEVDTSPRVLSHSVSIQSLRCQTEYHFKVISKDVLENTSSNNDTTFTTSHCSRGGMLLHITQTRQNQSLGANNQVVNQNSLPAQVPSVIVNNEKNQFKFTKTIKLGTSNAEVKKLQEFLDSNGFGLTKGEPVARGQEAFSFNQLSKNALIKFQKSKGLKPDGIFGPLTRKAVNEVISKKQSISLGS